LLIPGFNLFLIIFLYIDAAFLRLIAKNIDIDDKEIREINIDRYYRKGFGLFFAIPCFLIVFCLSVVFFVLNIYYTRYPFAFNTIQIISFKVLSWNKFIILN